MTLGGKEFNMYLQLSSGPRCMKFGPNLHLRPYIVCVSGEGSDETARMSRLD